MFSGYWQLNLDPRTKHKTTFVCYEGLYQYKRILFGLQDSPSAFMSVMSYVIRDVNWNYSLVYMDDILIFSKIYDEHLFHLDQVFQKLREAYLSLKPSKCILLSKKLDI